MLDTVANRCYLQATKYTLSNSLIANSLMPTNICYASEALVDKHLQLAQKLHSKRLCLTAASVSILLCFIQHLAFGISLVRELMPHPHSLATQSALFAELNLFPRTKWRLRTTALVA